MEIITRCTNFTEYDFHCENENTGLKCDLCSQYNIKSVWASEGTPNIQNAGN